MNTNNNILNDANKLINNIKKDTYNENKIVNEKIINIKRNKNIQLNINDNKSKIEIVEDNNSDDENESDISDEFNVDLPDDLR